MRCVGGGGPRVVWWRGGGGGEGGVRPRAPEVGFMSPRTATPTCGALCGRRRPHRLLDRRPSPHPSLRPPPPHHRSPTLRPLKRSCLRTTESPSALTETAIADGDHVNHTG